MNHRLSEQVRARLALLPPSVPRLEPDAFLARGAPGRTPLRRRSAHGHCRLLAAKDGWIALNLARPDDCELVSALVGEAVDDPWAALAEFLATVPSREARDRGVELQMPIAQVGETPQAPLAPRPPAREPRALRVVDLSALWAGPLCASLLAQAGAEVVRLESLGRPDPTPITSPDFDRRLNGAKRREGVDLRSAAGRAALREAVRAADVLVTSARADALAALGLVPELLLPEQPRLVWVAITAHGWRTPRVGFGDDCAAAGGLLGWGADGPRFLGDALADPLTGLEAALAALDHFGRREGGLLDVALARVAASYAAGVAGMA